MIPCIFAVLLPGCTADNANNNSQANSQAPDARAVEAGGVQAPVRAPEDIDMAPTAQTAKKYRAAAYDAERLAVSKYLGQNPQVYVAQMEPITDPTQGAIMDVVLRPNVSNAVGIGVGKWIEKYMSAHFKGDRTYILEEVHVCQYTEIPLNSQDIEQNGIQPFSAHQGKLVAYVSSGENDTNTVHDSTWHLTDQTSGDPVTIN